MERAERIRQMREGRGSERSEEPRSERAGSEATRSQRETPSENSSTNATEADATADDAEADATADATEAADSAVEMDADSSTQPTDASQPNTGPTDTDSTDTDPTEAEPSTNPPDIAATVDQPTQQPADGEPIAPLGGATLDMVDEVGDGSGAVDAGSGTARSEGDAGMAAFAEEVASRAVAAAAGETTSLNEDAVRVLEFSLGGQGYCIDIEAVEEIVPRDSITRVPNTPAYVEGVVDLRGQITTILDTEHLLDVEEPGEQGLMVVFAPDAFEEHGAVGWLVDEVRQVAPVTAGQVQGAPGETDHVRGVLDRGEDEDLVLWIDPDEAMTVALGDDLD